MNAEALAKLFNSALSWASVMRDSFETAAAWDSMREAKAAEYAAKALALLEDKL